MAGGLGGLGGYRYEESDELPPEILAKLAELPRGTGGPPPADAPSLTAYEPSMREWMGDRIYDGAVAAGLPSPQRQRENLVAAVDFVPGPGDAIATDETRRALSRGDYLDAAMWGVGALTYAPVGKLSKAAKEKLEKALAKRAKKDD